MRFHTRKWIKPEDLNPNGTLFGGRLLEWIDEEAALYAIIQLENRRVVTKFMSEINFRSSAKKGDIVEIRSLDNTPIGIGITGYDHKQLIKYLGKQDKPLFIHYDKLHIF